LALTKQRAYDASELVRSGYNRRILIDQGTADPFLAEQLLPHVFERGVYRNISHNTCALHEGLQPQLLLHRHA